MTRKEAVELVRIHDGALDEWSVRDFCDFLGYTRQQFWDVIDQWFNRDLFEKNALGQWRLKDPLWAQDDK
jgi:hypothetical protein